MTRLLVRFDMRHPDFVVAPRSAHYSAALEMTRWADAHGFTAVALSEHHGVADGYLPSPLVLAAGMLACTERLTVSISALLAVLSDPVRIAEEIAVLDNMAPGRLVITIGLGYRAQEYAMFGVERRRRGALLDEHLEVMLQAWKGEPFDRGGTTITVTPPPATDPHPLIFIGGASPAAARRAARFNLPFSPDRNDPQLAEIYEMECAKHGVVPAMTMPTVEPCFVHVTEDPERTRAIIAKNVLYDAQSYAAWQPAARTSSVIERLGSAADLAGSRVYRVLTPDQTLELAHASGTLIFHPLVGGLQPELGWESLQLFFDRVAPRLAR